MGFFDGIFKKIPFVSRFSKKKAPVNNVELQYNKAMNLMDNGDSEESVKILEQVADIGIMDTQYKSYGDDALLALAEFYEKGVYRNAKINVDMNKSTKYYEKYVNQNRDGDVIYKLAKMMLEIQNFSKAIKYFEMAATDYGIKAAYMSLGSIYESGLNRIDEYGNKSDFVVPVDLEKAMQWYKKLADAGDAKARASYERVLYASTHEDSLEFEEKDKLYTEISQRRKEKGKEPRYKVIEASRLQYQYSYVHNQVEGYIHKLPKDWVKTINESTGEEYYAPSLTYKDFAIYVYYDSIPKDSKKTLENYLRYCNDAFDEDLQLKAYITEYADGICTTYYHKDMEKGIVSFAFYQGRRLACMRFVCATMEIIEQYEEIIFEVANSFAFIDPTLVSEESANRRDMQYYNEAIYCYYLEDYEGAMKAAKQALKFGSIKASYLLVELYYDEDSPYRDLEKTISYAKQLFEATKDPELAFLINTAAVVGHHDGSGTGLLRLQCALNGHHALDDEGALRQLHDLGQLLHTLAAGGRGHVLQEGQTRCVHVHGHGKAAAGLGLCHFLADGINVPRLDGGHAAAARSANGAGSHLHHGGVGAVAGKGSNAVFGTGAHQYIVIGHIGVGIGVVQVHCTHRACKEGIAEAFAEQLQRGVRCTAGAQGVHVYPDIGPLIIIADSGIAHALGTRAGDLVFTGHAVAHRAGLAVLTNAGTGIGKYFRISHKSILLIFPAAAAQNDPPQCSLPSI